MVNGVIKKHGKIKNDYWKNPLAIKVRSRRLLKNSLANHFIRCRRLARLYIIRRDHEHLERIGSYLANSLEMYEEYFTDHEFAQLIGANYTKVKQLRQEYNLEKHATPFFVVLIIAGLEQDHEKPLANALIYTFKSTFDKNPALRQKARDLVEELIPEIRERYYKYVGDAKGSKNKVKDYPPLKIIKR